MNYRTQEEAAAALFRVSEPGDTVTLHQEPCATRYGKMCSCNAEVYQMDKDGVPILIRRIHDK